MKFLLTGLSATLLFTATNCSAAPVTNPATPKTTETRPNCEEQQTGNGCLEQKPEPLANQRIEEPASTNSQQEREKHQSRETSAERYIGVMETRGGL